MDSGKSAVKDASVRALCLRVRPEAVLFDMDGLLLDTERIAFQTSLIVGERMNRPISEALAHQMIGLDRERCNQLMRLTLGADFPIEEFVAMWREDYAAQVEKGVPSKAGALALMTRLKQINIPCAVVTSTQTPMAQKKLATAGLLALAAHVVGRDQVEHGKPSPAPYLEGVKRLGVAADCCWAFEDSLPGLRSAAAAGAQTHWVPDLAQIHADDLPIWVERVDSLMDVLAWL